jgi:hypothetical protein
LVATIRRPLLPAPISRIVAGLPAFIMHLVIAAAVWQFAHQQNWWPLALAIVLVAEAWPARWHLSAGAFLARATPLVVGFAFVFIIALLPKALAQVGVAVAYAVWRLWYARSTWDGPVGLVRLMLAQAVIFEAVFLMSAIWQTNRPLLLALLWGAVYVTSAQALTARQERAAGALAAAWALVATECAWVFLTWLVSYLTPGDYVIVPQAALVLTALGYCFGNIYAAQRSGTLNRARLTEYLLIGLILIWIVIIGTPWRAIV